ncbi:MAG: DUF1919 domain-containing protein [Lachnospiraceae bacterium]|nr:DUF1919 domain-containing protein [Lachnospiraceae bacterium]MCM1238727.1 DUF1919 domain-containing protein [Lachnospiraceae bacterium]
MTLEQANKPTAILWADRIHAMINLRLCIARHYEDTGELDILGITTNDIYYEEIYGYQYIKKADINPQNINYVIALETDDKYTKIRNEIISCGFSDEAIIPIRPMTLDGFTVQKYNRLKISKPSIFSKNCWGSVTYNKLGLQFNSPTINMFFLDNDYIKFLGNPKYYLSLPLDYDSLGYDETQRKSYPIAKCDDILLHFNHYETFSNAEECWRRRVQRINWDNIFVMMYTEDKDIASQFVKLPYEKKICFVSFPTDEKSLLYIDYMPKIPSFKIWQTVINLAGNNLLYYDIFDLLNDGKVTRTTVLRERR